MPRRELHEANRLSWNAATVAHNSHKAGQAEFLRGGGSTLFPEETALLGDVRGARVLHLCCNAGPDTLSIAALGARVTGVDISDEAIDYARRLSAESGIAGEFVRADVYDHLAGAAAGSADLVFMSYGAIIWLSDLHELMRGVARVLAPGGRLVIIEFHPVINLFGPKWEVGDPYFGEGRPQSGPGVNDYVGDSGDGLVPWGASPGVVGFANPHDCHAFSWTVSEQVNAVIGAGLRLTGLVEYPHANGCKLFEDMIEQPGRRFVPPPGRPGLPMMLALTAERPR